MLRKEETQGTRPGLEAERLWMGCLWVLGEGKQPKHSFPPRTQSRLYVETGLSHLASQVLSLAQCHVRELLCAQ